MKNYADPVRITPSSICIILHIILCLIPSLLIVITLDYWFHCKKIEMRWSLTLARTSKLTPPPSYKRGGGSMEPLTRVFVESPQLTLKDDTIFVGCDVICRHVTS